MKKHTTTNSPATLTRKAQAVVLQKHILAFIEAQMRATEALEAINAIALCESEGNPLPCALQGTTSVLGYAAPMGTYFNGGLSKHAELFDDLLTRSKQALDASGYWASNA